MLLVTCTGKTEPKLNWKSQEAETPESEEKVKKSRFSEVQILGILKQAEAGRKTEDLCREQEISPATFYTWAVRTAFAAASLSLALPGWRFAAGTDWGNWELGTSRQGLCSPPDDAWHQGCANWATNWAVMHGTD